jgi:hypothetical protein
LGAFFAPNAVEGSAVAFVFAFVFVFAFASAFAFIFVFAFWEHNECGVL